MVVRNTNGPTQQKNITTRNDRMLDVSNEMSRLSPGFLHKKKNSYGFRTISFQYLSFCFCWKKVKWSENAWDEICPVYDSALCCTNWKHKKKYITIEATRVSNVVGSLYLAAQTMTSSTRIEKKKKQTHEEAKKKILINGMQHGFSQAGANLSHMFPLKKKKPYHAYILTL